MYVVTSELRVKMKNKKKSQLGRKKNAMNRFYRMGEGDLFKFLVKQDVETLRNVSIFYCYNFLFYIHHTSCRKRKRNEIFFTIGLLNVFF